MNANLTPDRRPPSAGAPPHQPLTPAAPAFAPPPRWAAACLLAATLLLALGPRLHADDTVIFTEDFEGNFPADVGWSVLGFGQSSVSSAYWEKVKAAFGGEGKHSGSWKGYCAGSLYSLGGSEPNPTCLGGLWLVCLSRSLDLSDYSSATLTFWHKMLFSGGVLKAVVALNDGAVNPTLWSGTAVASSWTEVSVDLTPYVGGPYTLYFLLYSSAGPANSEGWYLDDIVVRGVQTVPLTLTQQPQSQSVPLGSPAAFRVTGSGPPPLSYQWFKDGWPLPGRTDNTLNIPSAQFSDIGVYAVEATDSSGHFVVSCPAVLVVQNDCVNYEDLAPPAPFWYYGDQFLSGDVTHTVGEFIFRNGLHSTVGTVALQLGEFGQEIYTEGAAVFFEPPRLVSALTRMFHT